MEDWKPTTALSQVIFEKMDATGSSKIRLNLYDDGCVYLQGALEVIFEGKTPLESALKFLQEKGYKKKDLSP
jgi:hypothetical protein